jgi:predicted RNA binding protein YcfA (HicA-like mRNA interferase family)
MGNFRSLPTKCWEAFLTLKGFKYSRTQSSHDQWTKHGHRTIPVWGNEKEIPAFHLRTGCKTIGCKPEELYDWAAQNC